VLHILVEAVSMIKQAPLPSVPLEVAVLEIANILGYVNEVTVAAAPPRVARKTNVVKVADVKPVIETTSIDEEKTEAVERPVETVKATVVKTEVTFKPEPEVTEAGSGIVEFGQVAKQWEAVMQTIKPRNHSLEALLRSAKPISTQGSWLEIEVYYTFHKEQLEQDRHRKIIEEVITAVVGQTVKCRFSLAKRAAKAVKQAATEVDNVTGSVEDEALAVAAEEIFG
jgi:hypothetical protein